MLACHKQIHALFTNTDLKTGLNTFEALRENEEMVKFLR
ncbi:hypothetical protein ACVLD2_003911 [Paenibacillus sp. PvR052]